MIFTRQRSWTRRLAVVGVLAMVAVACGDDDTGEPAEPVEGDAAPASQDALEEGGSLTIWAWEPTLEQVVEDFQAEYPEVEIELANVGTGDDQYTALQNAIAAGDGVPDVAQIEYYALPQFALAGSVTDLFELGASELDGEFAPGPWSSSQVDGSLYGLPMDSGPMALFYNQDVFEEHGIDVPTTWDEYLDAARELNDADPDVYITNDTGDAGLTTSLIWQAGGQPYEVDGTEVAIDFDDEGTSTFVAVWDQLIEEELLAPISSWSDEWYQGLGDGTIASLATGAWMPANLESGVPDGAGSWRVAPLPDWNEGEDASAENGGSSLAIPAESDQQELAYAFLEYANAGPGVDTRVDGGAFPATVAHLESEEFIGDEFDYFDGQQANEVFAESSANVREGWSYLPFQVYANSIFNDTVGQAYVSDTTLDEGLQDWQDSSARYGEDQGFTVSR